MKLNRLNYEQYFIDYLDGKLNREELSLLLNFLDEHADLKEELYGMEAIVLEAGDIRFTDKKYLNRNENCAGENYIACLEGDMTEEEEIFFILSLVGEAEKARQFELFKKARLRPDHSIVFERKSELRKRKIPVSNIILAISSVAAILILAVILMKPQEKIISGEFRPRQEVTKEPKIESVPKGNLDGDKILTEPEDQTIINLFSNTSDSNPAKFIQTEIREKTVEQISRDPILISHLDRKMIVSIERQEFNRNFLIIRENKESQQNTFLTPAQLAKNTVLNKNFIWALADAGIRRIKDNSEGDFELSRQVDESGRTNKISFETPVFGFSAPMGRHRGSE